MDPTLHPTLDQKAPPSFRADPVDLVDRTLSPADAEIVAFIVAGLSYGRVEQIQRAVREFLKRLGTLGLGPAGEGIAEYLRTANDADFRRLARAMRGWVHRMNTARDLLALAKLLSAALREHGSLCRLFQLCHHDEARRQVEDFVARLLGDTPASPTTRPTRLTRTTRAPRATGKAWRGTGVEWFASSPANGGTCKRLMMWMRWMIRHDDIDLGTWLALGDPALLAPQRARLFMPVDTHIFRWARREGVVALSAPNWKCVEHITQHLRTRDAHDPVRFDFEICHAGMSEIRAPAQEKTLRRAAAKPAPKSARNKKRAQK